MADNQIDEVKRKTDIVELVGEYVELKKAGRNYKGLCPFHSEKTPSFMVSPEIQIFKCFGCSVGGDVLKFVQDIEKIDFPQALKILADRAGIKLKPTRGFSGFEEKEELYKVNFMSSEFYHYILATHPLGELARQYLARRGITENTIKLFNLGFAPDRPDTIFQFLTKKRNYRPELLEKAGLVVGRNGQYFDRFRGRIIFPLWDHYGNVLGFSGRVIQDGGDIAKYINSPDTLVYKKGLTLFGLNIAKKEIKSLGFAVVVEGEFDLLSSYQAGVCNVVAIKGSAFTPEQAELISRFCPQVRLALDADFAGDRAARRGIDVLRKANLGVRVVKLEEESKDPDELARTNPEVWKQAVETAESIYDFLIRSAFAKFDPKTIEGKEKISHELSPVLASIEDEIVKAHCIKIVAGGLNVSEEAVGKQAVKFRQVPGKQFSEVLQTPKEKTRREILEERLLGLILQSQTIEKFDNVFTTYRAARLYEELTHRDKDNFDAALFAEGLPPELKDFFGEIFFVFGDSSDIEVEKEIENVKNEIEILQMRQKLQEISEEIGKKEKENDTKSVQALGEELDKLGNKLARAEKE